ncbi:L-aminoadipate-semialdehyde dehydrogenase [Suillus clintonianus]|uniref:L-aminoadipate-semialdehyde dehydrogenase n=1 Tax=Suillus clintonianus TaxID=1904413 RepID=UPI001B88630A|nr:L-aminoadipate-semialdehyde dehydrogenase [Suillus clintonianus]KAG2150554.1 L-aminoadipate-semialdehyde dehydrogenase [Suillus clintonianus]
MSTIYSFNHLIAERTRAYPNLEILGIPDKDFNYIKYTLAELDASASLVSHHLRDNGLLNGRSKGDVTSRMTVGLLGISNISYVVTEMALYRMGYCVLFLSPNNSPPAIAHLLTVTNATHFIVQDVHLPSATAALTHLSDPSSVTIINQPSSEVFGSVARSLYPEKTHWDPVLNWEDEFLLPVTMIHSSGSTGFPKPIVATNKAAVGNCIMNFGLTSLTTLPLYHGHGHSNLYRAIYSAKPLYLFPTGSIPLTSANVIKLLKQAPDVEALYGVPLALKLLAETPEGLQVLKGLKLVMFGGSACPDELGDFLVNEGVRLVGHYGLTEMGQLMTSFRNFETDKDWNWPRAKGPYVKTNVNDYLRFEPRGGDIYELFVLDGWPMKVMTNQPDGSYATKDLFIKHPTIPDAYKFIGRIDDTLVMVNGEKTNPVPMELTLRSSPYIADAVIFGAGRIQIGALILPTEIVKDRSPSELVKLVAPIVALANAEAPSHSQLATEALVFLPYGTVIPRADKGSILRPRVYKEFEGVINEVYKRLEGDIDGDGKRRLTDEAEARTAIRDIIGMTVDRPIDSLEDDTDLFDFGLDSLQSSRIRNTIQREIDLGGKKLSPNAVFEHPSIMQIARLLVAMSSGKEGALAQQSPREIVLELVKKYSSFAYVNETHVKGTTGAASSSVTPRVVVLTGATGSLGAYILDELLSDPSVATVYCLCRAKDDADASSRIMSSMKTRKLSSRYEQAQSRVKALASDLPMDKLGLQSDVYNEIARRATLIIHNAWAVNFNLGISSFEPHIRGAVNLINLALASPHPRPADFYFASSISAVAAWRGPESIPEAITDDPSVAQGLGYAQSKWVTEKLCQVASQQTPIRAGVLRIGQMVGDSQNGVWNETEAISLIIKCTDTIGILPNLEESVSWLPVDYAAKTIVDLVNVPPQRLPLGECPVWNVIHPKLVPWSSILSSLQHSGLKFKALPRHEWIKALRASPVDEVSNPSRKLLTFFENKYGQEELATRYPLLTVQTEKASESLRSAPIADVGLVGKWVAAWRETGFLA